ncbi:MAG TPA: exodeoxyribonuclease VII large subunit, partial [Candidatus Avacidaminococcus intestinavium]|nr:exodeoxyribonuclease VII large subunit [Candidatus Avacidaminococcus intestinavium]
MNNKATLTVSEVTSLLKNTIETKPEFINLQIAGEISNFRRYASGHCYFTLKDSSSILKAVMFKGRAFSLKFAPKDGDKVVAIGRIGVYERDGVYQLYTDLMYLSGTGDLMINYEILKNKLAAEGLFASERKKRIPQFAKKIGVITSSSGAAIHDIITVAQRRNPGVELYLLPVTVQGSEAKYEVTKAIEFFNKY